MTRCAFATTKTAAPTATAASATIRGRVQKGLPFDGASVMVSPFPSSSR